MLAEGILTRLIYKEICHGDKPQKSHTSKKHQEGIWSQKLVDNPKLKGSVDGWEISAGSSTTGSPQGGAVGEAPPAGVLAKGVVSPALHIPRRQQSPEQLELHTSCSCSSIYHHYPDLHIGGDPACDSGCVVDHVPDGLPSGPVLVSVDLPLGQSLLWEHPAKPGVKSLAGDEAGERSIVLCEEPLSNSLLNKYMETKVAEFYKQFFVESLARCGSVTNLLTCPLIRNNLNQLSLQISQEQNMETSKAREVLLHSLALFSLCNAANRNSSEFSTPDLQISN
ncbi:Uncharacterized protein CXorf21, partial [Merops nubicus]